MKTQNPSPARYLRLALITLLLIGISLACNSPGGETSTGEEESAASANTEDGIQTAVAQTIAAKAASGQPSDGNGTNSEESAIPSDTPQPLPTDTPGPTETPTLTPTETYTPTPEVPMIQVSVSTNCRLGPGKVYDRMGALLEGEETEIIAKDPSDLYWYVRNPDQAGAFCWLWGQYATTTGDTEHLPVFTPPPTPTPALDFSVKFKEVEVCGGQWTIEVSVTNTGGIIIQSFTMSVNYPGEAASFSNDNFTNWNGCGIGNSQQDLTTGEIGVAWPGPLGSNPNGKNVTATITVYSENGQGGLSLTKTINFKP